MAKVEKEHYPSQTSKHAGEHRPGLSVENITLVVLVNDFQRMPIPFILRRWKKLL
jgi:hypothetical protein